MANEMVIDIKIKSNKEEINAVDKAIDDLTSSSKKAGKEVDGLGKEVKEAGKGKSDLEKVKGGLLGIGSGAKGSVGGVNALKGAVGGLMKMVAPLLAASAIIGFTKKSLEAFGEFEKGMNSIFTLLPAKSAEAEDKMKKQVRGLAKDYGVEMSDATSAVYNALSAGVSEDNVFKFVETGVKASKAGLATLDDSVAVLNTVMNNYRADALDVNNVSDLLFATVKKGVTSFPELASSIGDVLPTTSAANVNFQQVSATMATLTATMGKGSTAKAGTAMRAMFEELNNSGSKTYKLFKQLNGGVDFKTFMKNGGNVSQALGIMQKQADKTKVSVADLFTSVESKKAVNILQGNKQVFDENLKEFQNVTGATDEAYAKMNRGWGATTARLKSSLTDTMISFGDAIAPLVGLIGQGLIEALNLVTPAFDLLGQGIDVVMQALAPLGEAFNFITGSSSATGIEKTSNAFANLSPIAKELVGPLTELQTAFSEMFGQVQEAVQPAIDRVSELWNTLTKGMDLGDVLSGLINGITAGVEIITPLLSGLASYFTMQFEVMMNVVGLVGSFFSGVMKGMGIDTQSVTQFLTNLSVIGGGAFKALSAAVSTAWNLIKPVLDFLIGKIGELVGLIARVSFKGIAEGVGALAGMIRGGNGKKNALGTDNFSGGTTTISEQGKEMFATPSGLIGISPNSRSEMMLPKGTQIFSNKKTQKIMNMAKNIFNNGGTEQKVINGGNSINVDMPINIANVTQQQLDKINKLRPIIISLIENVLSDKESERAYKWGEI